MRVYVQNAYAVLIVPEVLKAGFFLGGEYGVGVLLVRDAQSGGWGQPAFYSLYGGSLGVQFGGSMSDRVFTIMNEGAVKNLIAHKVQFGGDMSIALGRLGAGVGAGTTTQFGEDVYAFSKSKGLFGGVALDGTVVAPKHDWNEAYYGRAGRPDEDRARAVERRRHRGRGPARFADQVLSGPAPAALSRDPRILVCADVNSAAVQSAAEAGAGR